MCVSYQKVTKKHWVREKEKKRWTKKPWIRCDGWWEGKFFIECGECLQSLWYFPFICIYGASLICLRVQGSPICFLFCFLDFRIETKQKYRTLFSMFLIDRQIDHLKIDFFVNYWILLSFVQLWFNHLTSPISLHLNDWKRSDFWVHTFVMVHALCHSPAFAERTCGFCCFSFACDMSGTCVL